MTPAAVSSPKALPPESTIACTSCDRVHGVEQVGLARARRPAPHVHAADRAASARTTVQPVGRRRSVKWPDAQTRTSVRPPAAPAGAATPGPAPTDTARRKDCRELTPADAAHRGDRTPAPADSACARADPPLRPSPRGHDLAEPAVQRPATSASRLPSQLVPKTSAAHAMPPTAGSQRPRADAEPRYSRSENVTHDRDDHRTSALALRRAVSRRAPRAAAGTARQSSPSRTTSAPWPPTAARAPGRTPTAPPPRRRAARPATPPVRRPGRSAAWYRSRLRDVASMKSTASAVEISAAKSAASVNAPSQGGQHVRGQPRQRELGVRERRQRRTCRPSREARARRRTRRGPARSRAPLSAQPPASGRRTSSAPVRERR